MQRLIAIRGVRTFISALLTFITILALPTPRTADARTRSDVRTGFCAIDWRRGDAAVRRLIRCAEQRWSVPGGTAKAIDVARCESGFEPDAYSSGNEIGRAHV